MVYLSKIYTKSGDKGETGLGDGSRVSKVHPRVEAYGVVDELNANLGVLVAQCPDQEWAERIRLIQNDLFDLGADLCIPESAKQPGKSLAIQSSQVTRLEQWIDQYNESLQALESFILPGGSVASAWCHLARTVCRRAERAVVHLGQAESYNPQVLIYLNRLSDLLFVLARVFNNNGKDDVLWMPGKSAQ